MSTTRATAVVIDRKRRLKAVVASGIALAFIGGGAGFSLLTEQHHVNQDIQAGGQMALSVNGDRSDTVTLDVASGALPGDAFTRDVVIKNEGDVTARISLAVMDATADGVSTSGDAFDALVNLALSGAANQTFGAVSALPEKADDVAPQVSGFAVLAPGDSAALSALVSVSDVGLTEWAAASGGSSQVVLRVVGEQATAETPAAGTGEDELGKGDPQIANVHLGGSPGNVWWFYVKNIPSSVEEYSKDGNVSMTLRGPDYFEDSNTFFEGSFFSPYDGGHGVAFDIGETPKDGQYTLTVLVSGNEAETFDVTFSGGTPSW